MLYIFISFNYLISFVFERWVSCFQENIARIGSVRMFFFFLQRMTKEMVENTKSDAWII